MTIARTICLGFIAVITVGTLLLMMPFSTSSGSWNDIIVALFTSTSAVCVTGLAVVDTGTYFSFWGQFFIALLAQVGGLGYMATTTLLILLIGRKFDLQQKFAIRESFDRPILEGSQSFIRSIIATTLLFEVVGTLFLFIVFSEKYSPLQALWLSIFHSVSAWNNAGFSLFPDNLMSYHSSVIVNLTITGLIIFGGIGYQVIMEMYSWLLNLFSRNKNRFAFTLNFKVATNTTLGLLIGGTVGFFLLEYYNERTLKVGTFSLLDKILAAWFQSVTSRTAGFNTIDIGKMTIAGLVLTMGLMFIGASPGGTGGGIKTTTLRILSNCTRSVLKGQEQVVIYQREVPHALILKAVAVVFGSAMTVIIVTFVIAFLEFAFNPYFITGEHTAIEVFFEVISAFGTVGLSTGITAKLSAISKVLLVITMYIGRVGVILLMAAIVGDPRPTAIQYPEENLLVG